jgi:cytochrome c oxidase subunit IV
MSGENTHITPYRSHAIILIILLVLTTLTVTVAELHLGAWSAAAALTIACVKVWTVITNFMHLKFESLFLKLLVAGVFAVFALVVIITFIDYLLR